MKNNVFLVLITLALAVQLACKDKKGGIYASCCGTASTVDSVQIGADFCDSALQVARIYIPNIFIPDTAATGASTDPGNHYFVIFGNTLVDRVVSVALTDESGAVLYSNANFQVNDLGKSWNGVKANGSYYFGAFNYTVTVRFCNGATKTYTGSACAYKCSDGGFPGENLPDCFFPDQHDGYGKPLKDLPIPAFCF